MLVAYFDESGSCDETDRPRGETAVFAVAGYVARVEQWESFEQVWKSALYECGIESPFHMSEYESRKGQYASWNNEKRVAAINRLATIINAHVEVGVGRAVIVSDYRALIREEKELVAGLELDNDFIRPHAFCLRMALEWLLLDFLPTLPGNEKLRVVFEKFGKGWGDLCMYYNKIIANSPWGLRLERLISSSPEDAVPLQAADILAYETFKHVTNTVVFRQYRQRKLLTRLIGPVKSGLSPRVDMKWGGRENFEEVVRLSRGQLPRASQTTQIYVLFCLKCGKVWTHFAPFPEGYVRCALCSGEILRLSLSRELALQILSRANKSGHR